MTCGIRSMVRDDILSRRPHPVRHLPLRQGSPFSGIEVSMGLPFPMETRSKERAVHSFLIHRQGGVRRWYPIYLSSFRVFHKPPKSLR